MRAGSLLSLLLHVVDKDDDLCHLKAGGLLDGVANLIDNALDDAEAANAGIERLSEVLFTTLGLKSTLSAIGIDQTHFDAMAEKACGAGGVIEGFVPLKKQDVLDIYRMSL